MILSNVTNNILPSLLMSFEYFLEIFPVNLQVVHHQPRGENVFIFIYVFAHNTEEGDTEK